MTPVYELQARLRAAAIAGIHLLQEDFRLQRAAEAMKPLETASPVFAKLGQQMAALLSADCQNPAAVWLETAALADAVICTLGTVEVAGEVQPLGLETVSDKCVVNAPCSKAKGLIEALTASGSGNYALVQELHTRSPEIFQDYRVRHAMIQALGASHAELADAKKDLRSKLIRVLGEEPSNKELFLDMVNTEKGENKQIVLSILAGLQDERINVIFENMAKKKPEEVCEYLLTSTNEGAFRLITRICMKLMPEILEMQTGQERTDKENRKIKKFCRCVEALIGKSGDDVVNCYRVLLENKKLLDILAGDEIEYCIIESQFAQTGERKKRHTWEETIAMHLAVSLVVSENPQIAALALALYENDGGKRKNDKFLTAAALAKLYEDEDCTGWYEEQNRTETGHNGTGGRCGAIRDALQYVRPDGGMVLQQVF